MNPPRKGPNTQKIHLPPRGDPPTAKDTPVSIPPAALDKALSKKMAEWPKWVAVFVTLIGMIVGAAVWASSEHDTLKSYTIERDFAMETTIKADVKEQYVQRHEYTAMEQCLKDQKLTLDKIEAKLDKLLEQPHPRDR